MKRFSYFMLVACVAAATLASCKGKNNPDEPTEDYVIRQFDNEPFLGEVYISDYDYTAANNFLVERYKEQKTGACSSFRNGDFIGRNQDWYLRNYAMLVVHIAADAKTGRHASVNIVASNPFISREMIASGEVQNVVTKAGTTIDNWRDIFPIFTLDGINDEGLCANTNIVMHEEGVREGYKRCTGGEGIPNSEKTSFVSLVRVILDSCATCQEAINLCQRLHVTQAFVGMLSGEDNHVMVSDQDETVVLEWYNDEMVATRYPRSDGFKNHNMPAIMTNFFNCRGVEHTNDDGSMKFEELLAAHPYAMGVERYELLRDGWEKVNSLESAKALISKVDYSKFYNLDNKWYTENGAFCSLYEGTWYYPMYYPINDTMKHYAPATSIIDALHKMFEPGGVTSQACDVYQSLDHKMKVLDSGVETDEWYTEFTSLYDIPKKELYIKPQEGWYNNKYYQFTVFGNRK